MRGGKRPDPTRSEILAESREPVAPGIGHNSGEVLTRAIPPPGGWPLTLTIEEAAEIAGISRQRGYAAVKDGSMPVVRIANRLRVPTRRWLEILNGGAAA
jgi:excisionase family DNA binding protein